MNYESIKHTKSKADFENIKSNYILQKVFDYLRKKKFTYNY